MEKHFRELTEYESSLDFQEFNPKALETPEAYQRYLLQAKKVSRSKFFVVSLFFS